MILAFFGNFCMQIIIVVLATVARRSAVPQTPAIVLGAVGTTVA